MGVDGRKHARTRGRMQGGFGRSRGFGLSLLQESSHKLKINDGFSGDYCYDDYRFPFPAMSLTSSLPAPHMPPPVAQPKGMTSGLLKLLGSVQPGKLPRPGDVKPNLDRREPTPTMGLQASATQSTERLGAADLATPAALAGLHSQPPTSSSPFGVAALGEPTSSLSPFAIDPLPGRRLPGSESDNGGRMGFEELMKGPPLDAASQAVTGLDNVRQHLFGKYHEETEARMKELRSAVDGGISRARKAALDRVDELSAAMHRDMVALRQELQNELEELKRDVFSAVMSLSAINDKLGLADTRARETATAISKTLFDRVDQQSHAFKSALVEMHSRMDEMVAYKVNTLLQQAIQDMMNAQTGGQ